MPMRISPIGIWLVCTARLIESSLISVSLALSWICSLPPVDFWMSSISRRRFLVRKFDSGLPLAMIHLVCAAAGWVVMGPARATQVARASRPDFSKVMWSSPRMARLSGLPGAAGPVPERAKAPGFDVAPSTASGGGSHDREDRGNGPARQRDADHIHGYRGRRRG